MKNKTVPIREAAKILGVHPQTLRRWEERGLIVPEYTPFKQRRYTLESLESLRQVKADEHPLKRVALYCRVSSSDQKQKGDLDRQVSRLTEFAVKQGYTITAVMSEVGSGVNDRRKKLISLFEMAKNSEIDIVLIEHKDRLTRFCFNYLLCLFNSFGVRVEWVEESLGTGFEQELVEDILSIMTSFSARVHGRRSHRSAKSV